VKRKVSVVLYRKNRDRWEKEKKGKSTLLMIKSKAHCLERVDAVCWI